MTLEVKFSVKHLIQIMSVFKTNTNLKVSVVSWTFCYKLMSKTMVWITLADK